MKKDGRGSIFVAMMNRLVVDIKCNLISSTCSKYYHTKRERGEIGEREGGSGREGG